MTKNWEREKERLHDLYMLRRMKLATVSRIMAQDYGFQASERAYKQKFKEWKWFKKTPRQSPIVVPTEHDMPPMPPMPPMDPDGNADDNSPRANSLYRLMSTHSVVHRGSTRGMAAPLEHHYAAEQYAHIPVLKYEHDTYPPVTAADMGHYAPNNTGHPQQQQQQHMGPMHNQQQHHHNHNHHHHHQQSPPGMTLGPYHGRGPQQVPLPSVTHLQQAALKENLREAERRVEIGQYEQAEAACENAMRTLNWLKENRANGSADGM